MKKIPMKERKCDLGAACLCKKAGWKGECLAQQMAKVA